MNNKTYQFEIFQNSLNKINGKVYTIANKIMKF